MTTTATRGDPPTRPAVRHGVAAALSLVPAVAPLGFALGASLAATTAPRLVAWFTAPLMVAGSAQLVLVSQLDAGAPLFGAVAAALLLNGRFVVYGAALAPRFALQPWWFRLLGAHYVVDQTYGLVAAWADHQTDATWFRRFFTTSGTILWLTWTTSVGAGILAGPALPESVPVEIVLPVMFVALVVPQLTGRTELGAATAGATAAMCGLPPLPALLVGATAAGATGLLGREESR